MNWPMFGFVAGLVFLGLPLCVLAGHLKARSWLTENGFLDGRVVGEEGTRPNEGTLGQIQGLLVEAGARKTVTDYDDVGNVVGISFIAETVNGQRGFVLPVHAARVQSVLERERVPARYCTPEHAERVAWRIVKDWLEAQLAIIRTEMVTLDQVMLPYMRSGDGRSYYELYRENQLQLESGVV